MICVGAGKACIDLSGVLPFDGFDLVLDQLYVRTVAFQNPDATRACLVSVDATSLRDDAALREAAAAAAACDQDNVWIVATHSFSVPHVRTPEHLGGDAERQRNVLLGQRLVAAVKEACGQAVSTLRPACLQTAYGTCDVNANRDVLTDQGWWLGIDPTGFSDHSVRVLRAVSADDRSAIATLFSADVQSSVTQGLRNDQGKALVSADLAGAASGMLEERLGGVAIFLTGAAGDQTPREKGFAALPALSNLLAQGVVGALDNAESLAVEKLELSRMSVSCPAQRRADFHSLAPTRSYTFEPLGAEDTLLSVARLGKLTVVGLQPEVDSAFGARLRAQGKGRLELLTMVNGAQKYLPSADAYERITYEAMNSGFARGADEVLAQAILNLT